jgi:hypothetical protein
MWSVLSLLMKYWGSCLVASGCTLDYHIGKDFLHDNAANPTYLRIPFDVITASERLGHLCVAIEPEMHLAKQWSRGKRCR